jgi:hypothetical protein
MMERRNDEAAPAMNADLLTGKRTPMPLPWWTLLGTLIGDDDDGMCVIHGKVRF